ncbi:glycosyltransferase [Marmoricola sp. RAF53]|uniref:glycosyltransferase n=1 Tax=Marmoricola sp. RAF53 TaxID=3233059 RepID=UPI003F99D0D3
MKVTALLVSHNGARWLPAVLEGIRNGERRPDRIVAVDTGSADDSVALVEAALGSPVLHLDRRAPYAESVRVALESLPPAEPDEWVWLLHDDSNPAPGCLAVLTAAAEDAGDDVAALGPKHREWPSLKRLLEVGVTLTGTGQRETGLERGEYDQGQHDEVHRVLAVNTAGMLVRRAVLEQVGLDQSLPVFGTDVDFGWRVARAGHATLVVPDAVVFHVEASRRGRRTSELVDHPGRQEREGAQYTLLVNSPGWTIPFRTLRMVVGGLLRALGLLLVRAPGEAADEVAALLDVFLHPSRILRARRARAGTATVPHQAVRPLLAPFWLPYRHGLDYVTDVGVAVAASLRDRAERRRPPGVTDDTPLLVRFLRMPALWAIAVMLVLAVVAGHALLGTSGSLQGGALLPAPDAAAHWWSVWGSWRHTLGTGTPEPGGAYLLPLAFLGTLSFGHPNLVLTVLFVLAVPLAYLGAHRFLRRLGIGSWTSIWGAAAYGVLPVVTGAVAQGRIGTVAGAAVLPWLASAALGLGATDPDVLAAPVVEEQPRAGRRVAGAPEPAHQPAAVRRWRAAWRTAIAGGLLVAFVPPAWLVIAIVVLFASIGGGLRGRRRELAVVSLVPLLLVLPWAIGTLAAPGAWLVEAGRVTALPLDPSMLDLVLGRAGGPGSAPAWIGIGLPVAALVAFVRPDTRSRVLQVWVVVLAAAVVLAAVSRVPVSLPGVGVEFRPWPGFLLLLVQAGFVLAATVAADGAGQAFSGSSFTWRQPVAAVAVVLAVAAPVLGIGWWVGHGDDGPLHRGESTSMPTYMQELADGTDLSGVLRIQGGLRTGISYQLLRSGPERTGDDGPLALTSPDQEFQDLVERLLSAARPNDADLLASYGVRYVYAPAPVAAQVSGGLDAAPGFSGASAPAPGSRAWTVTPDQTLDSLDHSKAVLRPVWVFLSLLGLLVCIVLAAPERRRR